MKKKLFLAIAATIISMHAFSQITWNAKVGVNLNNMTKIEDADMKFGYNIGVGLDYQLTEMWSIQPSLMYVTKGFKISKDGNKFTASPSYLQLPVLAAVKFELAENTKLVINAGPYFAYGLGGKAKMKEDGEEVKYNIFSSTTFGDEKTEAQAKRFDFGLSFGVGVELNRFLIGLNAEYGLANVAKKDSWLEYMGKDEKKISPKNIGFGLSVGYRF